MKLKKRWRFLLILAAVALIFRLYLPTLVLNYANKALSELSGFHGSIEDIDIALIRGAYVIKGLKLYNNNAVSDVPFINFPKTDISVEWRALFKGSIVSEIYLLDPELIYVLQDMQVDESGDDDWTKLLTDLVPIDINHFVVEKGKFAYVDTEAQPTIDLSVREFEFTAENLRNVVQKEMKLPSPILGTGVSIGNGKLSIGGKINMIKQIPDADLNIKLESTDLTAFNEVSKEFGKIDFESGDLNVYSELAIADGFLKSYFKVLFSNVEFISEEDGFFETIWEGFAAFFEFILTNRKTENFAIKVPIEGQIESFSVKTWPAIGSMFKNGFIEALRSDIDDDIEYQDAFLNEKLNEELDTLGFFQFKKKRELKEKIEENEKKLQDQDN